MDPELIGVLDFVGKILPVVAVITAVTVGGWIINNWLRIKHGYPLDGAWGQALHPHTDKEAMERIKLLTSENAQLRAELGSVKDRLETIERIVTDEPRRLAKEIDALAIDKGGHGTSLGCPRSPLLRLSVWVRLSVGRLSVRVRFERPRRRLSDENKTGCPRHLQYLQTLRPAERRSGSMILMSSSSCRMDFLTFSGMPSG